jgi:hypothetical protein
MYKYKEDSNMKNIILFVMLLSGLLFAQTTPSGYTANIHLRKWADGAIHPSGDSLNANLDGIDTLLGKHSNAVLIKSDRTIHRYSTLKLAVADADSGSVITLYQGVYSDSVTVTTQGITIKGISKESVLITGALYITASFGELSNVKISGNLTFIGQISTACYVVNDCRLENNVNVGLAGIAIASDVEFNNCYLGSDASTWAGSSKTFYFNTSIQRAIYFHCCYSFAWHDSQAFILNAYSRVDLQTCDLALYGVYFTGGTGYTVPIPELDANGGRFQTTTGGYSNSGYCVMVARNCAFGFSSTITLSNHFQIQLMQCTIAAGAPNSTIICNSASNNLQIIMCYGVINFSNITGSGLANLHIQDCIFGFAKPTGIANDDNNVWNSYVDY